MSSAKPPGIIVPATTVTATAVSHTIVNPAATVTAKPVASGSGRMKASAVVVKTPGKRSRRKDDRVAGVKRTSAEAAKTDETTPRVTDEEEMALQKKKRLELNRLAASKSRKKKKSYIQNLNRTVNALTRENTTFWSENKRLSGLYSALREAHANMFEANTVMRRNIDILFKAYESVRKVVKADNPVLQTREVRAVSPVLQYAQSLVNQPAPQPFQAPNGSVAVLSADYQSEETMAVKFPATYATNYKPASDHSVQLALENAPVMEGNLTPLQIVHAVHATTTEAPKPRNPRKKLLPPAPRGAKATEAAEALAGLGASARTN